EGAARCRVSGAGGGRDHIASCRRRSGPPLAAGGRAAEIDISKASVSRILKRRGLSRLSSLELQEPHPRYEREKPGEIIHLDIKKLGRFSSVGHRPLVARRVGAFTECVSR